MVQVEFKVISFGEIIEANMVRRLTYYIDTDEIPGFFLLLKNHIFIARNEDTIFIFHV